MSTSPTTVALSKLLPSLNRLPPRLVSLAESLLALSRQRASTLKQNEEIARAHACAEIACSRLREKLRLPPLKQGTAPAHAKTYNKLVSLLETVLKYDVERLAVTPGKRKRDETQQTEAVTPSKRVKTVTAESVATRTPIGFVGKIKASPAKVSTSEEEAPAVVLPAIRKVCSVFGTGELVKHVYVGTCTALKLGKLWPRPALEEASEADLEVTDEMFEADMLTLVVGLYLMVLTRMMKGKMVNKLFRAISGKAVIALPVLHGDVEGNEKNIQAWVRRIQKEFTKGKDWWTDVPVDVIDFGMEDAENAMLDDAEEPEDATMADVAEAGGTEGIVLDLKPDPEGILLPGLGTMLSDEVDWTSEDRKRKYEDWKADILEKMQSMEQNNASAIVVN